MSDTAKLPNPKKTAAGKVSPASTKGRLLAGMALLVALIAAGSSTYLWWQLYGQPGQLRKLLAAQQDRQGQIKDLSNLRSRVESQLQQVSQRADALRDEVTRAAKQSSAKLLDQMSGLTQGQENLQDRVAEINAELGLMQRPGRKDHDWRALAEASRLLQIANEHLHFALDDRAAAQARQRAAKLLATVSRPEAATLLRALQRERQDLEKQFPVSVAEALQALQEIDDWVDSTVLTGAPPASVKKHTTQAWWPAVLESLSRLVRVEKTGQVPAAQWSVDAQRLLRLHARLTIATARLALLNGHGAQFAQAVERTLQALHRHFEPLTPKVAAASQELSRAADAWRVPLAQHTGVLRGIRALMRDLEPSS